MTRLIAFCALLASPVAMAQPAAPTPAPPEQPPTHNADGKERLDNQVSDFDWKGGDVAVERKSDRPSGFYVGANVAYATKARVEVDAEGMTGTSKFPAAFGADFEAGYRFAPYLSVALAPQMIFNLKPNREDAATELELFVQATGHLAVASRWDLDVLVAPGYSVLLVPDADDAKGLAFRWGGGLAFHFTDHTSFAAELRHQIGFQRTERDNADVDMETTFVSLVVGARFRL